MDNARITYVQKIKFLAASGLLIFAFSLGFFLRDRLSFKNVPPAETPPPTSVATKGAAVKTPEPKEGIYKVTKVIDGDTIEIETGERVRLLGIDTPELNARWGGEARKQTYQLVYGKEIRLELDREKRDKYGRVLAYVWLGDLLVNEKLVKDGYARLYVFDKEAKLKYLDRLIVAQESAKEHLDGFWFYGWDKNIPFYSETAP